MITTLAGPNLADQVYEELRARGVEFTAPPKAAPWGTAAIMKDPEGNVFVISSK